MTKRLYDMDTSIAQAVTALADWCRSSEIAWHAEADSLFGRYIELLLHAQQQTNLTGFSTPRQFVESLFVDSLQILRVRKPDISMLDIGTGAGFPGIPIKILCPETKIILVEPRTKRYAFLRLVERELGLTLLQIHKCRAESLALQETPQMVISKAFAPLPEWLTLTKRWAELGSDVACLVSQKDWDDVDLSQFGYQTVGLLNENQRVYAVVKLAQFL